MKIAIIGVGFTGLAAAWDLRKAGHLVTMYEANEFPGGLAAGFKNKDWEWSLEHHYHHIFRSDKDIQGLVNEMELQDLLFFSPVKTSIRYEGSQFQLDSPITLLTAPVLTFVSKIRTALTLAFLKFLPFWQFLDKMTAKTFILKTMGQEAWNILWEALFIGKFGEFAPEINAAWFWSRIHVRSAELGYFRGGFLQLAEAMTQTLVKDGTTVHFSSPVSSIEYNKKTDKVEISTKYAKKPEMFDQVLITSPSPVFSKITKGLSEQYKKEITSLQGLAAITLVLELDKPFFTDKTYWLNINEKNWPFIAVVEHTQFAGTHPYNDKTIVYVGKYLEASDPQFSLSKENLLKLYIPFLEKLSPHFDKHITNSWVFTAPFAQPIAKVNHSLRVPVVETPLKNVYWSSMQHVYPWDRGTNYAVALGRETAKKMMNVT